MPNGKIVSSGCISFRVLILTAVIALCFWPKTTQGGIATAEGHAYFYLSSDGVRSLRDVKPKPTLVLKWRKHVEMLQGIRTNPKDTSGILTLGRDYIADEEMNGSTIIYDFALRRIFNFSRGENSYENVSLYGLMDLREREAANRIAQGKVLKAGRLETLPGFIQHLYEASLGVWTLNTTPISIAVRRINDNISVRFKREEIARFRFGTISLTPEQGEILAKALRYILPIHPAALEAALPFRLLPLEISTLYAPDVKIKARTSITFELIGIQKKDYPLPPRLNAKTVIPNEGLVNRVIDIGLRAIAGTSKKKRRQIEDYAADANKAQAAGDRLGIGLAWLGLPPP